MTVPLWQPGTIYNPGDVVQPNSVNAITQTPINNPNFALGNVNWVLDADFTIASGISYNDTVALRYTHAGFALQTATNDVRANVTTGQKVSVACKARIQDQASVQIRVNWYNAGNALISTSDSGLIAGPEDQWITLQASGRAPVGAVTVSVSVQMLSGAGAPIVTGKRPEACNVIH